MRGGFLPTFTQVVANTLCNTNFWKHEICMLCAVAFCGGTELPSNIFLWLPPWMEDQSGLVCRIITFWEFIESRVFEGGGNDGFGGFLRFDGILKKGSKTNLKDRLDRSLFSASLQFTLEHFGALRYTFLPYLPLSAHSCMHTTTHHTQTPNTN